MKWFLSERVVSEEDLLQNRKKLTISRPVCTFQPGHFTARGSEGINIVVMIVEIGYFCGLK